MQPLKYSLVLNLASQQLKFAHSFKSLLQQMPPATTLKGKSLHTETVAESDEEFITILGFGSLLSEQSSRTTFPDLQNFRLGRVPNYRRVFGHPASIFFQRGIANLETKEMSSLSAEYSQGHPGFVCSIFEVPNNDMMSDGVPSAAFVEREEEFKIIEVPYVDFQNPDKDESQKAILCTSSTNESYLEQWGSERFEENYGQYGVSRIWGWERTSELRPCAVYLRHCFLASKSMGSECFDSFLDETFLVDRETTVREYVEKYPEVLETKPPPELVGRYSG
jgi:hypothetical protein